MEENLDEVAVEYLEEKKMFDEEQIRNTSKLNGLQIQMGTIVSQWKNLDPVSVDQELEFRRLVEESTRILNELTEIETRRINTLLPLLASTGIEQRLENSSAKEYVLKLRDAGKYDLQVGLTLRQDEIRKYEEVLTFLYELLQRKIGESKL